MTNDTPQFPANWQIKDYDPQEHMMQLKQRDYLNVQNRLLWFIRDQRDFIVRGLATTSYVVRTELIQHDREAGYAHFATYVRDVMGNEATMYGSETAKDFADYAEKASTKSLGRALLALGYGTAFAPEMDEGERVVDTPVERRQPKPASQNAPVARPQPRQPAATSEPVSQPTPPVAPKQPAQPAQGKMTREQFLASAAEMGLNPRQAMERLSIRSLPDTMDFAEALVMLRTAAPDLSTLPMAQKGMRP